jgi:hypothetical protein
MTGHRSLRRVLEPAARVATAEAATPGTHVTVVLPRRSYPVLASRLLHDHTADRIARVVSRVPSAAATIIPFDVRHEVETLISLSISFVTPCAAETVRGWRAPAISSTSSMNNTTLSSSATRANASRLAVIGHRFGRGLTGRPRYVLAATGRSSAGRR